MVDPKNITNYNLTKNELEEHILFWVCAAGKNGVTAAQCLDRFLGSAKLRAKRYGKKPRTPFAIIRATPDKVLAEYMMAAGIGCYTSKAKSFRELANSGINLKTCSVDDLEAIHGIGPKTARCFLMHSRPKQRLAGLDVHILKFLKDSGYNVPKSTPTGNKYKQIEQWFLKEADKAGKAPADFDLEIWKEYREK